MLLHTLLSAYLSKRGLSAVYSARVYKINMRAVTAAAEQMLILYTPSICSPHGLDSSYTARNGLQPAKDLMQKSPVYG